MPVMYSVSFHKFVTYGFPNLADFGSYSSRTSNDNFLRRGAVS